MIPRRLYKHIKDHNWFAVLIDLAVVIIGVFIGIQVSNWNAARLDDNRAHGYLERIRNDLDADIANYRDRIAFWKQVTAYGSKALAYANTGDAGSASQWELLLSFYQASQLWEFYTTDSTYDELKSAGELQLIDDTELRANLAAYYVLGTRDAVSVFTERPAYRPRVRGIVPIDIQKYIWTHCWASDIALRQTLKDCAAPVSEAVSGPIVESLRRDSELIPELQFWLSTLEIASSVGQYRIANAEKLRASVEALLSR
jgi:hypothetical protein